MFGLFFRPKDAPVTRKHMLGGAEAASLSLELNTRSSLTALGLTANGEGPALDAGGFFSIWPNNSFQRPAGLHLDGGAVSPWKNIATICCSSEGGSAASASAVASVPALKRAM